MKQNSFKAVVFAAISFFGASAWAATITVTSGDFDLVGPAPGFVDKQPNATYDDATFFSTIPENGTPGVCTLREAILTAEGERAKTVDECFNAVTGAKIKEYCPFHFSTVEKGRFASGDPTFTPTPFGGECDPTAAATAVSADDIVINVPSVFINIDYPLPPIRNPLTITGQGPDQTRIVGNPAGLASFYAPPAVGAATKFVDLPIFQVLPALPSGATVKIDNLTVSGTRVHYFRSGGVIEVANPPSPPSTTASTNCDVAGSPSSPAKPLCCGPRDPDSPHAPGAYPACTSVESNKTVVNLSGIVMDNAVSAARKTLTVSNARLVCNRRGTGGLVTSGGTLQTGDAHGVFVEVPPMSLPSGGAAVAVLGRAILNLTTDSFAYNVTDFGPGGAVFAGSKDNASPQVDITGSLFGVDPNGSPVIPCTDSVFATHEKTSTGALANEVQACTTTTPGPESACPSGDITKPGFTTAYNSYGPDFGGNFAGATTGSAALGGPFPGIKTIDTATPDLVPSAGRDGGAVSVSAASATIGNIGAVTLTNSRFIGNIARGNAGALNLSNVASSDALTLPAFTITDSLFTGNKAVGSGGAMNVTGNADSKSSATLSLVSFGGNRANQAGGALHFKSTPNAPIDFSLTNVRMSQNAASVGGAIHAEDNGSDDSGLLNISKATFDANVARTKTVGSSPADGAGGAIFCGATKVNSQFTNVTLSGNLAGNGGGLYIGTRCHVNVNNATITANNASADGAISGRGLGKSGGGGILVQSPSVSGDVKVRNSVIALNTSFVGGGVGESASNNPSGPDCSAVDNAVLRSAGFNFVGAVNGCGTSPANQPFVAGKTTQGADTVCLNNVTGDRVGDDSVTIKVAGTDVKVCPPPLPPMLRGLNDNGGPDIKGAHNFTHIPDTPTGQPASILINNGNIGGCRDGLNQDITQDERELFRNSPSAGSRCDIGAVEVNGGANPNVAGPVIKDANDPLKVSFKLLATQNTPDVEMLRMLVTAPSTNSVSLTGMRVQTEVPAKGVAGQYSSIVSITVSRVQVNTQGVITSSIVLHTISGSPILAESGNPLKVPAQGVAQTDTYVEVPFDSPVDILANGSEYISVSFTFGPSSQLAMAKNATMVAAAGGIGFMSFLGLIGAGMSRRKALGLALLMLFGTIIGGCNGGGDEGGGTPLPDNARVFQVNESQMIFSTQGTFGNVQSKFSVHGPAIAVSPP